jgi:hypothetical protein
MGHFKYYALMTWIQLWRRTVQNSLSLGRHSAAIAQQVKTGSSRWRSSIDITIGRSRTVIGLYQMAVSIKNVQRFAPLTLCFLSAGIVQPLLAP